MARRAGQAPAPGPGTRRHVLRGSCATIAAAADVPQHEIQLLLGHADPRMTAWYIHHLLGLDGSPVYTVAAAIAPVTLDEDAQ